MKIGRKVGFIRDREGSALRRNFSIMGSLTKNIDMDTELEKEKEERIHNRRETFIFKEAKDFDEKVLGREAKEKEERKKLRKWKN